MLLGVYLFLTVGFILLTLLSLPWVRERVGQYLALSLLLAFLAFSLFVGLSAQLGILGFGWASSYNYPLDYLKRGPLGWLAALLFVAGMVSPVAAGFWLRGVGKKKMG